MKCPDCQTDNPSDSRFCKNCGSRIQSLDGESVSFTKTIQTSMKGLTRDAVFPYETTVKPMFDLLGTPNEDKSLKLNETDHFIPNNELIKESLGWLDKYLGQVERK